MGIKGKNDRMVVLACEDCKERNYTTTKNKKNIKERLELSKYCPTCKKHTNHKETKQRERAEGKGWCWLCDNKDKQAVDPLNASEQDKGKYPRLRPQFSWQNVGLQNRMSRVRVLQGAI